MVGGFRIRGSRGVVKVIGFLRGEVYMYVIEGGCL